MSAWWPLGDVAWSRFDWWTFAALVIALGTLISGAIGIYLVNDRAKESQKTADDSKKIAEESVRVAREALEDARQARLDALWNPALEAVQRMIGVDPTVERPPFRDLAVHLTALVDALPTWTVLDEWVAAEHALGAAMAREAMEKHRANPPSDEEEQYARMKPFLDWSMALSQNFRYLRRTGHDAEALAKLRDIAKGHVETIHERHGWDLPESALEPLDVHPDVDATTDPESD